MLQMGNMMMMIMLQMGLAFVTSTGHSVTVMTAITITRIAARSSPHFNSDTSARCLLCPTAFLFHNAAPGAGICRRLPYVRQHMSKSCQMQRLPVKGTHCQECDRYCKVTCKQEKQDNPPLVPAWCNTHHVKTVKRSQCHT
jgi:hypothetical protein